MRADDRDYGIAPAAREALGGLLDTPMPNKLRHLTKRTKFAGDVAHCGAEEAWLTESDSSVDCPECKAEVTKRHEAADLRILRSIRHGGTAMARLPAMPVVQRRDALARLESRGEAYRQGAGLRITDLGKARLTEVR